MPKVKTKTSVIHDGPRPSEAAATCSNDSLALATDPVAPKNGKAKKRSSDGICKSKQLAAKRNARPTKRRKTESKRCDGGRDEPPRPDLKRMFDSSDDEPLVSVKRCIPPPPALHENNASSVPNASKEDSKSCMTLSIETPPPVAPQNKRKKTKGNLIKPTASNNIVSPLIPCSNLGTNDVLETPSETRVKDSQSPQNSDSDKTELYEYSATSPTSSRGSRGRSFSPLPSTSRDTETFEKNDILLQESLRVEDDRETDDDVEIIDVPCETIIVDDNGNDSNPAETIDITCVDAADDDVELVSYSSAPKYKSSIPKYDPIPKLHDPMMTIDEILFGMGADNLYNSDCEIVDVDNVIAENQALLGRIKNKNKPTTSVAEIVQPEVTTDRSEPSILNLDTSTIITSTQPIPASTDQPTENDFIAPNIPSTVAQSGDTSPTISAIIDDFFKTNPTTAASTNTSYNTICCTLSNILDHMSNILTGTQNDAGTSAGRNVNKQHLNSYANSLTVVDTVDLDDSSSWRVPALLEEPAQLDRSVMLLDAPAQNVADRIVTDVNVPVNHNVRSKDTNCDRSSRLMMECPICMESLGSKPIASTICGHIFCMVCIQKALSVPGGKRCPTCRKAFKKNQSYHPLFL